MDALVIGGGIAGVSVAYELSKSCQVMLLEAERDMPVHTTGRSAAVLLPAYGNQLVRALTAESRAAFESLPKELGTPSLLRARDILYVAGDEVPVWLPEVFAVPTVESISVEQAVEMFPALRPGAVSMSAVDRSASDIDVLGLYHGYVRGMRAHGGVVKRGARVTRLARRPGGWEIGIEDGERLGAANVINAAGAWADEIAALAGVKTLGLSPLRRSVFVSPVAAPKNFLEWPMIFDAHERFYAKPEGDALLCSPAEEVPSPPGSPQADELRVAETLELLQRLLTFPLRTVRTQWAGLRTFAPDRSPVAGPAESQAGFWWLAGQGGYGIQMAPALAQDLARQVLAGDASRYGRSLDPGRFQ